MEKVNETTLIKQDKLATNVGRRILQVYAVTIGSLLIPATANAALSDWFVNMGQEIAIIIPIVIVILGAVGVVLAGIGIISAIGAKKNRQPMEHQPWLIAGGALLVLLIPLVSAVGESISGENAGTAVQGVLN
jgi:hypothetical protein